MGSTEEDLRARQLAANALQFHHSGQAEGASKTLREAISLAPNDDVVKEALRLIQISDTLHPVLRSIQDFVNEKSEEAGNKAIKRLDGSAHAPVPADVAKSSLELLLKERRSLSASLVDRLSGSLLRGHAGARSYLAQRLSKSATLVFEEFYELGEGAANALATVVLDVDVWPNQSAREIAERDVFQLFLAKLLEVGHDHDGKALKGIARLLAADSPKLHGVLDKETFEAILCSLDHRLPVDVRSQATLATAKYLEASPSEGQAFLLDFIQTRVARQRNEDLITAFSAAAAVFPLVPSIASSFFLFEGFVPSLPPLLQKKLRSEKVEYAALEMLSAACLDSACRRSIQQHCTPWLHQIVVGGEQKCGALAAVILAKTQDAGNNPKNGNDEKTGTEDTDIVHKLRRMMLTSSLTSQDSSIEGLAYASSRPYVKEQLVNDKPFLQALVRRLKHEDGSNPRMPHINTTITFGILTIFNNLTRYLPTLTEEQKKMSQLKAYANASPASITESPMDSDATVTKRCTTISTETELVATLVSSYKHFSASSTALILSILLSLCRDQKSRGVLAQKGAAKLLLHTYTSITGSTPEEELSRFTASHALSRILITSEPPLIFPLSGSPPLSSTIRPLVTLLSPPPEIASNASGPRDLLPTFESLLALTNLASTADQDIGAQIIRLAAPEIEELVLSSNTRIRRAATELCCNLTLSPSGIALFAASTPEAKRRIHILLALADSEDAATRRAAGGAIAAIVGDDGGVQNVLMREGGVERLVQLVEDDDEGCTLRGLVALGTLANHKLGRQRIKEIGAPERVKKVVERADPDSDVRSIGNEVLDVLGVAIVDELG